jgi:hypothetical protein
MALGSPPVLAETREMFEDYPGHIERLQEVLNRSVERSRKIPFVPLDDAIWALEGTLEAFIMEASDELEAAEKSGNPAAIAEAHQKKRLMSFARSSNRGMTKLDDLWEYFDLHFRGV